MAKSAKRKSASGDRPQKQRICNLLPSHETEKDWTFSSALAAGALAAPPAPPASIDLRAKWWDVGDQKDTGSCVGWASTDGVARYLFVKSGRLDQKEKLSPRFTWMVGWKRRAVSSICSGCP